MFKVLEDDVAVSPQITAADVAEAASLGYAVIVCNRPDGEDASQPTAAEIEDAAKAAGLSFLHVPIGPAGISDADVDAMAAAIDAPGKTLAYCRSGTRSTVLWAMARARSGASVDELMAKAAGAGYDLAARRPAIEAAVR